MSELSNEPTLNDQIGTLSGDTPLSGDGGALGEVTFSDSGPTSVGTGVMAADPMAKLHAPAMPGLKQHTTTTVTASGGQPDGSALPENPSGSTNGLVGFAKKFLGVPYVWGGTSPTGFDCSGFVQYVYRHMGVNLPRISADQARAGKRISFADLRPGDLVAIDNSSRNNGADHIGIYVGNGMVINAPRPGRSVEIDPLSAFGGGWGVRLNLPGGGSDRPRNKFDGSL
jgi:cell wall-associated NlpC family hydrolase